MHTAMVCVSAKTHTEIDSWCGSVGGWGLAGGGSWGQIPPEYINATVSGVSSCCLGTGLVTATARRASCSFLHTYTHFLLSVFCHALKEHKPLTRWVAWSAWSQPPESWAKSTSFLCILPCPRYCYRYCYYNTKQTKMHTKYWIAPSVDSQWMERQRSYSSMLQ